VHFGSIVLEPSDQLDLENLGGGRVVGFIHLEIREVKLLHIVHREDQVVSKRILEAILNKERK
jgi:hypothetical protein